MVRSRRTLDLAQVDALRAAATRFGRGHAGPALQALRSCTGRALDDVRALIAYHDCLLFMLAYPQSPRLLALARRELDRVVAAARLVAETGSERARERLAGSGIAWSENTHGFGWDVARWLVAKYSRHAEIDSFGKAAMLPQRVLAPALTAFEYEQAISDDSDAETFVELASTGYAGSRLEWLVGQIERLQCPDLLREQLFEALEAFITLRPRASRLSRTRARGLARAPYFQRKALQRNVDIAAILDAPLPKQRSLGRREGQAVIDVARGILAVLGRETDAIARASPQGVAWHDLGRGIAIALYTMRPERRSPLDSHVGMMLFRNGLPVGYGGGWPFFGTCRIGVNIFEPYRGGESALLFCQALRVFRQCFAVERFIAEPSQYGGTGMEGLTSGAFWFYYRLGFRPIARRSAALAEAEFARQQARKSYRTPVPTLRRFTRSDIELWVDSNARRPSAGADPEPIDLNEAVNAWVARRFRGDRAAAEAFAMRTLARALGVSNLDTWSAPTRFAFGLLAPLLAQIRGLERWPAADRRTLAAIIRAKGTDEFLFFRRLRRHARLRRALADIAERASAME